jgi:hypothetical protein
MRARMVKQALASWSKFLKLPFAEKIFLDDRSPGFGGLNILAESSVLDLFTSVQYQTIAHAPHSNFGIVGCMQLASAPFILHLDDDVFAAQPTEECQKFIEAAIGVMEKEPSIMGCNMLTQHPATHGQEWLPGEKYQASPYWSHPNKLFGTGGCIIRRELVDRVPFGQLLAWGDNQPDTWERLVTNTPREFLTGPLKTPFGSLDSAFFYSATAKNSMRACVKFEVERFRRRLRNTLKKSY